MFLDPRTRPLEKTPIKVGTESDRNADLVTPAQHPYFAILCSHMHMAWMRYVCGRLKSDFRYSNTIVYNNFPWPSAVNSLPNKAVAQQIPAQAAI